MGRPGPQGWPVSLSLLLTNPNSQAFNVLECDYDLWLEGQSVAQGAAQKAIFLPAQGEVVAEFPILIKMPALLGLLPGLLQRQQHQIHYQISGGLRLASVLGGLIRIPFRFQGQATLKESLENLRHLWR